ncbi:MAG: hypothetical protein MAG795_00369 [Candidatus Woesearchaeota archaeon]|nr:hypothetical protein [Candidatus Woesearchaeota archaeon]
MKENVNLSISEATRKVLKSYPYLDGFLKKELANTNAVARFIKPKVKKLIQKEKINDQAIVMAIIRYCQDLEKNLAKSVLKAVASSTLTLKTDMMYLNIEKSFQNIKIIENFSKQINWNQGEVFYFVQGIAEILVVLDKINYEKFKEKLKNQEIKLQFPSVAVVVIRSPIDSPGVIHFLTKDIAEAGISIEMITLTRDTIMFCDERNATRLLEILKNQIEFCRKLI